MSTQPRLRLALDQNFPTPLIDAVRAYLPNDLVINSLDKIDPRLGELSDRQLFVALYQMGWDGLITNNDKMLHVPAEIAAIVRTKAVVVAVEGLGHDPLRAVGALLMELPGLADRIRPGNQTFSACLTADGSPRRHGSTSRTLRRDSIERPTTSGGKSGSQRGS